MSSPQESSNAPSAEIQAAVSVGRFEEMVKRLASLLNQYTGELSQRVAEHERTAQINDAARHYLDEASNRISGTVTELNNLSTRYTGVAATELPVVAYVEVVSRASNSVQAVSQQLAGIDARLQSTLSSSREHVARAMQEVAHTASTFPQAVGSRVHETALRIDEQHNLTGRTAATVAALDERYGIRDRARQLDERYGISDRAAGVIERGRNIDEQYLGGRASRVATTASTAATTAGSYVAERTERYRQQQLEQEEQAAAAEGEKGAEGGSEGIVTRATTTATTLAQGAMTRAAELDSKYGVTAGTVERVGAVSAAVDSRLGVSERASKLDERYGISDRAAGVIERGRSIDEQYLGGRAKAAWDSSVDYVSTRVAERADGQTSDPAEGATSDAQQQPEAPAASSQ